MKYADVAHFVQFINCTLNVLHQVLYYGEQILILSCVFRITGLILNCLLDFNSAYNFDIYCDYQHLKSLKSPSQESVALCNRTGIKLLHAVVPFSANCIVASKTFPNLVIYCKWIMLHGMFWCQELVTWCHLRANSVLLSIVVN